MYRGWEKTLCRRFACFSHHLTGVLRHAPSYAVSMPQVRPIIDGSAARVGNHLRCSGFASPSVRAERRRWDPDPCNISILRPPDLGRILFAWERCENVLIQVFHGKAVRCLEISLARSCSCCCRCPCLSRKSRPSQTVIAELEPWAGATWSLKGHRAS